MAKPKTVSFSKTWDFENKYFVKFKSETDRQAKRIANNLRNNDKVKKSDCPCSYFSTIP